MQDEGGGAATDDRPPAVVEGFFRLDGDTVTLLGGRSAGSGLMHFPRREVCPYTGADDVEPVDLPRTGTLWAVTTVNAAPPGYRGEVPYGLGVVELDGGLRVVGRIIGATAGAPAPGTPMEVVADTVPADDGTPRIVWAFAQTAGDAA